MVRMPVLPMALLVLAAAKQCTVPEDTTGADDGNPHCWTRARRCDGPNAHPDGGPGYQPPCGVCEGVGGIPWGDENDQITIPACTPLSTPNNSESQPITPEWGVGNGGKFTIESDRLIMIGPKTDPFCFGFGPSNSSRGALCYRRQTGTLVADYTTAQKSMRYDLNVHIPWPSEKFSVFGNVTSTVFTHGPNMWIINSKHPILDQCICMQPYSGGQLPGQHDQTPIFPVMYNWTKNLRYVGRERITVEYGIGDTDLEHWTYGPHHAWTAVGDNKIIRMWQPYNGFEVFQPGSWRDGVADPAAFEGMIPPAKCVKGKGGALMRIGCQDNGFPKPMTHEQEAQLELDLHRARTKVPRASHRGDSFENMARKLNKFLVKYGSTKECRNWTVEELQQFQAVLLLSRLPEFDDVYQTAGDRRKLRGSVEEHGGRWQALTALAKDLGQHYGEMHRDGHCHEAVMWFVHHIPEIIREELASRMPIPLLPYRKHTCSGSETGGQSNVCDEYLKQVSCQDCHQDANMTETVVV
eukprot:NODE_3581_length_2015_cov_40.116525.p1 GENE.NODE_3581_length_2015_cov_40.116525~~NODE_3581_length_2015_cov_40.116525.p1  ORF type:complete len:524 (+),score=54.19 NODE_3581_length_2015_cov_40.116525:125-1696(+)